MSHCLRLTTVAVALLVANLATTGWETWLLPDVEFSLTTDPVDPVEDSTDFSVDELICESARDLSLAVVKGGGLHPFSPAPLYAHSVASDLLRPPRDS